MLLDSDGVLADLATHWTNTYNKLWDDTLSVEQFAGTWNGLEKQVKPECGEQVYDIIKQPGFFQGISPLPGAIEAFRRLVENPGLDCYVVTAYSGSPEAAKGKLEWYEAHAPFFDPKNILLCKPKQLVYGDFMVDDSPKNLRHHQKWMEERYGIFGTYIMTDASHNQDFDEDLHNILRFSSLAAAVPYLETLISP